MHQRIIRRLRVKVETENRRGGSEICLEKSNRTRKPFPDKYRTKGCVNIMQQLTRPNLFLVEENITRRFWEADRLNCCRGLLVSSESGDMLDSTLRSTGGTTSAFSLVVCTNPSVMTNCRRTVLVLPSENTRR